MNTIFTTLTKESWDTGLQWVRTNKRSDTSLLVIDMGLEESSVNKLKELGVRVVTNTKKTGTDQIDVFNSFLEACGEEKGRFLFWDIEVKVDDVSLLSDGEGFLVPPLNSVNITSLVFPLVSIDNRVKFGRMLDKQIPCPCYSGLMSGTMADWKLFVGLFNALIEMAVVDSLVPCRNLVLNFFATYFPKHVTLKYAKYEIRALQQGKSG